jgi:hypothetical protein
MRAAHERLKRMTREEFLEISVAVGVDNPDGTLAEHLRSPKKRT